MARLVPCLVALRAEFDEVFPDRNHGSDGWIGDPAHQTTDSDHNADGRGLVHAIDVDADLSAIADMQDFVDHVVGLRDPRLTYVIYNRVIWSASRGWKPKAYAGPNPHDKHAHFSADDIPARENDTSPWYLEEVPVALTAADKAWISGEINKVEERVWDYRLRNPYSDVDQSAATFLRYAPSKQPITDVAKDLAAIKAKLGIS